MDPRRAAAAADRILSVPPRDLPPAKRIPHPPMTTTRATTLVAAALLALPGPAVADLSLDVMTFNIRYGTAHDRQNNWPNRQDMVVNMLRHYDADIIGTQELLPFQADYITHWLPEYRWFGAPRNHEQLPERSAILYKWRELVPMESGTFWLSETPTVFASTSWNTSVARVATWARFHHLETGTTFFVYNTHLDHISQDARLNGTRVILEHAKEHAADHPVVFMGDFNAKAGENEAYHVARDEGGFHDAWLEATERRGPTTTWNAFRAADPASDQRIDWILTRGGFLTDLCETVTYSEDNRQVSDHFPVFAKLRLAPKDADGGGDTPAAETVPDQP